MRNVQQLSPLIVQPSPGLSIGLVYVYTSTHVSIKTVYNASECVCWTSEPKRKCVDKETENDKRKVSNDQVVSNIKDTIS